MVPEGRVPVLVVVATVRVGRRVRSFDTVNHGGRGLDLVDILAAALGRDLQRGGKTAWFQPG